jgi:hypothetical protein
MSRGASAIWKFTLQHPPIGAKVNGGPAINDGTKGSNAWWHGGQKVFNNYYTLNNSISQSGNKSLNAQVKRSGGCNSTNLQAE